MNAEMPDGEDGRRFDMGGISGPVGRFRRNGNESTGGISINASFCNQNGSASSGPVTLLLRFPEDMRREKITIKLQGLDLP